MNDHRYRDVSLPEETGGCLLCDSAPCAKACPHGIQADAVIRSLRFDNPRGAASRLPDPLPCPSCEHRECLSACLKGRINRPVPIDAILREAASFRKSARKQTPADLSIGFCGVRCENPFFLSSSVVANNYEMVAKAFERGWAGAVFKTVGMFVPDEVSPRFGALDKESVPFVGFENIEQISEHTLEDNLLYIRQLKRDYPSKVIVGSIMGRSEAEWTALAERMTAAGADILECNFSCPHMAADGLGSDVGQNPELVAAFTRAVRRGTDRPILAKMTPNIARIELPAIAAVEAGADGIAAINTIKSILKVDLDTFAPSPAVGGRGSVGGYSGKAVKPIALRFIRELTGCGRLRGVPVSGMGGIETWRDAAEFLALGCENIQVTTAVMQYGYRIIDDLTEGMREYLGSRHFQSVSELVGRALPQIVPAEELDRSSLCYPKFDRKKCLGCGRCYLSCFDGGHQAIRRQEVTGKPVLDAGKCVGCHLCAAVCPVRAITPGARVSKVKTDRRTDQPA